MVDPFSQKVMQLTSDQKIAFDEIIEFLKKSIKSNSDECMVHTLIGYVGSGKTTLTRFLTDWCNKNNMTYAGVAPTHKAKKVLENILNKDSFIEIITSIFLKIKNMENMDFDRLIFDIIWNNVDYNKPEDLIELISTRAIFDTTSKSKPLTIRELVNALNE